MDRRAMLILQYQNNIQKLFLRLQDQRRKAAQRLRHVIFTVINTYLLAFGQIIAMQSLRRSPRMWMKIRSSDFWERIVLIEYLDEDWLETFRMKKSVFDYICDKLQNRLQPAIPFLVAREPISVQKAVAVTIFYLASCCEYRVIGNLFGIHKTSVWRCVHKVVKAINDILQPLWIEMPNEFECIMTTQVYEERTHIPQLIGAIDGTHIPVLPPADGYRDYINRKGWPSMILQGLVDHTLSFRFRNINCHAPGSAHDAAVFKESNLFHYYKHLIPQKTVTLNDVEIPFMIMGDPAYPLLPWLLKGYTKCRRLTPEEESFNVYLSTGRVDIEIAFGRLKARWRRILKRIDVHYTFAPQVIAACCVLHNIVEFHKQEFRYTWMKEIDESNVLFPQPEGTRSREYDDLDASNIRNRCNVNEVNNVEALYDELMDLIVRLANHGVIHGDFNEFNIMMKDDGKPVIIDFPQMVSTEHENAESYFERDINCIRDFFKRRFGYESELYPTFQDVSREDSIDAEVK